MFTTKSIIRFFILGFVILMISGAASASPQLASNGTGFTYQGKLIDGGSPANGSYDFQFRLFDALISGNQVGGTITRTGVNVTNGIFTVQLDFGNIFNGTALYLEIGVRPGGSSGSYTSLSPLQPLTPTPYAQYSTQAGNTGMLNNQPASYYLNASNINSGTLGVNYFNAYTALGAEGYLNNAANSLALNNGILQSTLNADLLDGQHGAYYLNASKINSGTLGTNYFSAYADLVAEGYLNNAANNLALNNGTKQATLNADFLDGLHAASFALASHTHWGESWTGSGTGLTLSGGTIGLSGSGSNYGLFGNGGNTGTGVFGKGDIGVSGESNSTAGFGVYAYASATSGTTYGVMGFSDSTAGTGVYGVATAVSGNTIGVSGTTISTDGVGVSGSGGTGINGITYNPNGYGVSGTNNSTSDNSIGVSGTSQGITGIGVAGFDFSSSATGVAGWGGSYGVWGKGNNYGVYGLTHIASAYGVSGNNDSGTGGTGVYGTSSGTGGYGVYGTNTSGTGIYGSGTNGVEGSSNITGGYGIYGQASGGTGNYAGYFQGNVHVIGNISITGNISGGGSKSAVVDTQDYGTRTLYAVESPENWFQDFGTGQLTDGKAVITIDPIYAETVTLADVYHVFFTPMGDCALYVTDKTPTSFTVRALGGQTCSIAFDYNIVAKRLGYETVRLAVADTSPAAGTPNK